MVTKKKIAILGSTNIKNNGISNLVDRSARKNQL